MSDEELKKIGTIIQRAECLVLSVTKWMQKQSHLNFSFSRKSIASLFRIKT